MRTTFWALGPQTLESAAMDSIKNSAPFAACALAAAVLFGLWPSAALADCERWELLRKFNAVQENGFAVVFDMSEVKDGKVSGKAHYYTGSDFHLVEGDASGTFDGQVLDIGVWWPANKALGRYRGHVERGGSLAGMTQDLQRRESAPNPEVRWRSKQTFKCASGNRYCDAYANAAVAAAKEGLQLGCGFTGARWSADASGHLNWCNSLGGDHTLPNSEKAARAQGLGDCRTKSVRGQIMTRPPAAANDSLFKVKPK